MACLLSVCRPWPKPSEVACLRLPSRTLAGRRPVGAGLELACMSVLKLTPLEARANSGLELACMLPRRVTPNRAYQINLVRCMPRRVTPLITQILSSNGFRDNVHIALPHHESKGYHAGMTIFLSTLIVLFEHRIRPNKTRSRLVSANDASPYHRDVP